MPKKKPIEKKSKDASEKRPSKNAFNDFEEKQGLLSQALASSNNLYSSEASPEDRINARKFAIAYASQTPALRHIVSNDDVNVPNKVDNYLNLAKIQFTKERNYIVDKRREEVVGSASEKGLAKIVYGLDPAPIKENDSYKEVYNAHNRLNELSEILMAVQQGKASPEGLVKGVENYLREDIDESYKDNEALKDDKEYKEALINTALSGLGQREIVAVASNMARNLRDDMDKKLKTSSEKAAYAREILRNEKNVDKVADYLARASYAAREKED